MLSSRLTLSPMTATAQPNAGGDQMDVWHQFRRLDNTDRLAATIDLLAGLLQATDAEIAKHGQIKRGSVQAKRKGRIALKFEDLFLFSSALGVPPDVLMLPTKDAVIWVANNHPLFNEATTADQRTRPTTVKGSDADVVQWLCIRTADSRDWLNYPPAVLERSTPPGVTIEA